MHGLRGTMALVCFGAVLASVSGCTVPHPRADAAEKIKPRLQEAIDEIRYASVRSDTESELSALITFAADLRDPALHNGGSLGYYALQDIDGDVTVDLLASTSVDDPETTIGTDTYFVCVELRGDGGTPSFEVDVQDCPEWVMEGYGLNDYYELNADDLVI